LSSDGRVLQKKDVRVIRNYEAVDIAAQLFSAAPKDCAGYEVWRNGRRIARQLAGR
jgi:hypothetical protein